MTSKLTVDQCVYCLGPYKGYMGRAEYDADAGIFHGQVLGTKDITTFQARTAGKVRDAFLDSIDDYLDFCASRSEPPEKPFSGRFVARIRPELHRRLSLLAAASGKSLNTLVAQSLESLTNSGTTSRAPTRSQTPGRRRAGTPKSRSQKKTTRSREKRVLPNKRA